MKTTKSTYGEPGVSDDHRPMAEFVIDLDTVEHTYDAGTHSVRIKMPAINWGNAFGEIDVKLMDEFGVEGAARIMAQIEATVIKGTAMEVLRDKIR